MCSQQFRFEALPKETIDRKAAARVIDKLKAVDLSKKIYSFESAYDPEKEVLAEIDVKVDTDGLFTGNATIRTFSHFKTADHYSYVNMTDPDLPEFVLYEQVSHLSFLRPKLCLLNSNQAAQLLLLHLLEGSTQGHFTARIKFKKT